MIVEPNGSRPLGRSVAALATSSHCTGGYVLILLETIDAAVVVNQKDKVIVFLVESYLLEPKVYFSMVGF